MAQTGLANPASQYYLFNQTSATALQVQLTSSAVEAVEVRRLVFTISGSLDDLTEVVPGSVALYLDGGATAGLWDASDTLIKGNQSFSADNGSVTFTDLTALVTLTSGVGQNLLLVFNLNGPGGGDFSVVLDAAGMAGTGVSSGRPCETSGSAEGNTHYVTAPTPTILLNLTHGLPDGTGLVRGAASVSLMTLNAQVAVGPAGHSIRLTSFVIRTEDQSGVPVAINAAFSTLAFATAGGQAAMDVSGVTGSAVTLALPADTAYDVDPAAGLSGVFLGDVARNAAVTTVRIVLQDATSATAQDVEPPNSLASISDAGDSTGFPMKSRIFTLTGSNLAESFGNYPNPFRAGTESTVFEFHLFGGAQVSLDVYDSLGSLVKHVFPTGSLGAGYQRLLWDGRNGYGVLVVDGVYYARLKVGGETVLRKVAVVK